MPSLLLPPAGPTRIFDSAIELLEVAGKALRSNARNANVILPSLLKISEDERRNIFPSSDPNVWITYTSERAPYSIEFIVACTHGYNGLYPVFIYTSLAYDLLTEKYMRPCLEMLAKALKEAVPVKRVYSVFSPEPITTLFVEIWTKLTGVQSYVEPYYGASITYCTKSTFVNRSTTIHPSITYEIRLAVPEDIKEIAEQCHGFASSSFPFVLTKASALKEAKYLVDNGMVWIHRIRRPGELSEIASIVACTRNSETVATITKVYTNPTWRCHGCAERLVRRVCKELLLTKEAVVLYVAHENLGAAKVYKRVGFVGVGEGASAAEGVDPWLEIGFNRDQVVLGHW